MREKRNRRKARENEVSQVTCYFAIASDWLKIEHIFCDWSERVARVLYLIRSCGVRSFVPQPKDAGD